MSHRGYCNITFETSAALYNNRYLFLLVTETLRTLERLVEGRKNERERRESKGVRERKR